MILQKKIVQIVIMSCILAVLSGCREDSDFYIAKDSLPQLTEESSEENEEIAVEEIEPQTCIYVQVCGAVHNPGVYSLTEGSRVFEAIELAGGLKEDADLKAINQAQILTDGQMVYVYAIGEAHVQEAQGAESFTDGKVNINTASVQQLMTLPGIGESKARQIIDFREENGGFERIEDIMNISGIKEGVFSKIKDFIKVN